MTRTSRQPRARSIAFTGLLLLAVTLVRVVPAAASFSLDYIMTGRIWVPELVVECDDIARTDRELALLDFRDCTTRDEDAAPALKPRQRDCRFEGQLAETLQRSGSFRRVTKIHAAQEAADLVLVPLGVRVQFQRRAIPAVKPLLLLSLFTYVWTPLPYERDTETYHLNLAVLDRHSARQATVMLDREHTHCLGTYSSDHRPPADLIAAIKPHEVIAGGINTCRGPHAGDVVHELLRQLAETVQRIAVRPPESSQLR